MVTGHLSEGSFVQSGVVQIPKFDNIARQRDWKLGEILWVDENHKNGQLNHAPHPERGPVES